MKTANELRRKAAPGLLLYVASIVVVTARAPLAVALPLDFMFPVVVMLAMIMRNRPVPPVMSAAVFLVAVAVWIWCVGVALTRSYEISSVAAPVLTLLIGLVVAITEGPI